MTVADEECGDWVPLSSVVPNNNNTTMSADISIDEDSKSSSTLNLAYGGDEEEGKDVNGGEGSEVNKGEESYEDKQQEEGTRRSPTRQRRFKDEEEEEDASTNGEEENEEQPVAEYQEEEKGIMLCTPVAAAQTQVNGDISDSDDEGFSTFMQFLSAPVSTDFRHNEGGAKLLQNEDDVSIDFIKMSGSDGNPGTIDLSDDSRDSATVKVVMDEAVPITESPKRNIREEIGFNEDDEEDGHRTGFAVPSTAEEIEEAKVRWGDNTWQMKALSFINSDLVQRLLVGLLVMDVFILLGELGMFICAYGMYVMLLVII